MLVHYFWLLEFKFKFEFYCLKPFCQKAKPFSFSSLTLPLFRPSFACSPVRLKSAAAPPSSRPGFPAPRASAHLSPAPPA
jgi:hypothetical protein